MKKILSYFLVLVLCFNSIYISVLADDEEKTITVCERYVENKSAYDEDVIVLGEAVFGEKKYGEKYVSDMRPESIEYDGETYVLISDNNPREIISDEEILYINYKYVKQDEMFTHPGVLNTGEDLKRIAEKVRIGEEPYFSAYEALKKNSYAQIASPRAVSVISRGGSGANCALLYHDTARAYFCAIRWKIEGDERYGECAKDILNAWSQTLKSVTGNADRYLASGLYAYQLAAAGEIMRGYEGFELDRLQKMLLEVFYKPLCERFLYSNEYGGDHNGANISNYWANWDLCNMAASVAIGVFCDRRDIYDKAVKYYKFGAGNGSIFNAVPKIYEAEKSEFNIPIGQWQEAGRDMPHTELGIGLMATVCEIAWNQGDDLYGWANNRFMYGAEYIAEYETGNDVPFTAYNWRSGTGWGKWSEHSVIAGRSATRNVWEMVYNHYVNRMGYELPGVEKIAESIRPEMGPGSHASSFDYFGFGTLFYTREYDESAKKAVLPKGNVKEGIYKIKCRETGGFLTAENSRVLQYAQKDDSDCQKWEIADLGGGIYTVTNVGNGETMCVENESYSNGALIKTNKYTGKFSQQFAFLSFDDENDNYYNGYYRIVPVHSGLCVDVLNGKKDEGTEILQYTYLTGHNQQWELVLVEEKETEIPETGNATIEVKFLNETETKREYYVYNTVFDKDSQLTFIERKKIILKPFEEKTEKFKLWKKDTDEVKMFVWDKNLKPGTYEIVSKM